MNHLPLRYTETYECEKCGFTTPYPKSFERHQNRQFACDRFKPKKSLKYLMTDDDIKDEESGEVREETFPIPCPLCPFKSTVNTGERAKERAKLLSHLKFIHLWGLFHCLTCGKGGASTYDVCK